MANIFEFPLANPIKFFEQDRILASDVSGMTYGSYPVAYNQKPFDKSFFAESILPHEQQTIFYQPYQTSDYLIFQFMSSITGTSNFAINLIDRKGALATIPTGNLIFTQVGTYNGMYNYCVKILLYNMPEGVYLIHVNTTTGTNKYGALSEPIDIKKNHPNTCLCEYSNSYNDQSMIWDGTYNAKYLFRFYGMITDVKPDSEYNTYKSQPNDTILISGVPEKKFVLSIGYGKKGVPKYQIDKLERITMCNNTFYNGVGLTRPEGIKFEEKAVEGSALSQYTITLAERTNTSVIEINDYRVVFGNMPQTTYFWVESIFVASATIYTRKMFAGKYEFLNYLNQSISPTLLFTESADNKIIMSSPTAISGTNSLPDASVLKYCVKFSLQGSGTFSLDLTNTAAANYAVVYNDGYANVNKTSYTTSVTISKNYAATGSNKRDMYVFFSAAEGILTAFSATNKIKAIGGDLAANTLDFNLGGSQCEYIENNMWTYCTSVQSIGLDSQQLPTCEVDKVIKWLWPYLGTKLTINTDITFYGQTPAAPPSRSEPGMSLIISQFNATVSSLTTD